MTNNDRNPGKVKIPIPAPKIGVHNKSTIAGAKINPIDDEKISSVKNLSKVVELEQEENKEEKQKEKGEKTQSSSALTVGDRVLVNSR